MKSRAPQFPVAPPMPGTGLRLSVNQLGLSLAAAAQGASYPHPFRPMLVPAGVSLQRGLVENREPTINGVPIGGDAAQGTRPPVLKLDVADVNDNGESWVCVELTLDEKGEVPETDAKVVITHTKQPRSLDVRLARGPLVMLLWRDRRPVDALAIVHFNLRYARVLPPAGAGGVRHVFY